MTSAPHLVGQIARTVRNGLEAARESARARLRPMSGRERAELCDGTLTAVPAEQLVDPPRIVLDGVFFQIQRTGIARVWNNLMSEWSESGFARHVVVLDRCETAPRFPGYTYRRTVPFRRWDSFAQRVTLENVCRAEHADLFVSTYYSLPLATRSLLLIYDMIPEVMEFDLGERVWREKRRAIEHAEAYVAISENTARDLHRFYPDSRSRPLRVALNAAEKLFVPATESQIADLLNELDLPREYFLFIGPRDVEYKNASLVFEALSMLPDAQRPAMLFVGGSPAPEVRSADGTSETVARFARLSDEQLRVAYSGARGLLYPSKYEGFGIPILEAMACGCPVVTCNNSSIPEVAGDAAIYVAEDDPSELAAAMTRLGDPAVCESYRAKGFKRARRFRWKESAAEVERSMREMAAMPRGGA